MWTNGDERRAGTITVPGCWQLQGDYDPPQYTKSWHGRGPWENYPDRKDSAEVGDWTLRLAELNDSRYIRPSEMGYRTDVTRLRVAGFEFAGDGFGFNVWPWTQEAIEKAKHAEELAEDPAWLTVNIDCAMMGVGGDDAWGARPHAAYLLKGAKTYVLKFTILPCGTTCRRGWTDSN